MAIIIGLSLLLLSIGVVVYPFWKQRRGAPTVTAPGAYPLEADLQPVYDAIRTLQLEHQLGNIPLGLYREQLQDYRIQAALILRGQAEAAAEDGDWLLEQEIEVARAALSQVNGSAGACPNCGAVLDLEWPQCPECSAELSERRRDSAEDSPA